VQRSVPESLPGFPPEMLSVVEADRSCMIEILEIYSCEWKAQSKAC